MISLSNIFNQTEQIPTKTIKVKTVDHLIKQKPKDVQNADHEQFKRKKNSLHEQIEHLIEEIDHLEQRKQQLIQKTKREVDDLKEAWQQERETYVQEAQAEGFSQGFSEGKKESLTQFKHLIEEANSLIKLAKEDYETTIKESEPSIIKLAVKVAEKIIHKQLNIDEDIMTRIATDVIKDLTDQKEIDLFVSTRDYEHLLHQKKDLENLLQKTSKLSIYVDAELEPGMCTIEYPSGKTDASIQTQLQLIEDELLNIVMEQNK